MPHGSQVVIEQLIVPAMLMFFFIGGVVATVIAVGLIVGSPLVFRLFVLSNRYVSTRRVGRTMAIPRDSGPFVWKYRRPIGLAFVLGAAYSLWGLIANSGNTAIIHVLKLKLPAGFVLWIIESVRYTLIAGSTVALLVGFLMILAPDTLKAVDNVASRWVSTRQIAPDADKMNMSLDKLVEAHPRKSGLMLILPALSIAIYFGALVFN